MNLPDYPVSNRLRQKLSAGFTPEAAFDSLTPEERATATEELSNIIRYFSDIFDMVTSALTVECGSCGTVVHQMLLEDESHCPCWGIYDDEFGAGWREECECLCHKH
jgi:hypothetical protein